MQNGHSEDLFYVQKSAELLFKNQDVVLARNLYSFILRRQPNNPSALNGIGKCFMNLGETAAARKCFQQLIPLQDSPIGHLHLGQCYLTEGDEPAALNCFRQITNPRQLGPELEFQFYKDLGNCFQRLEKFADAQEAYETALRLNPSSDVVLTNLGTLEVQRGNDANATTFFKRALELNPRNARALTGIGLILSHRGDNSTALQFFERALDNDSQNNVALFQFISIATQQGSFSKARGRINAFLEKEPKNTDVRFALAVLLYKQGHWWDCEAEIERVLKRVPSHAKAKALKEELLGNRYRA